MRAVAEHFISEEEYLAMEEAATEKHEYYNGRIFAMSGGSNTHALLGLNAGATLRAALRGSQCRAVGSDQRVKIEKTGLQTYPDAAAYCLPARFQGRNNEMLLSPKIIIEVLSPSTEKYDRTDKFDHYKQIPELTDYILIAQERVLVEHFARHPDGGWLLRSYNDRESHVELKELGITLALSDFYEDVEAPSGLMPLYAEEFSENP